MSRCLYYIKNIMKKRKIKRKIVVKKKAKKDPKKTHQLDARPTQKNLCNNIKKSYK